MRAKNLNVSAIFQVAGSAAAWLIGSWIRERMFWRVAVFVTPDLGGFFFSTFLFTPLLRLLVSAPTRGRTT
jgi:hypothetical protein